ncbi:MAG: FAD-dependent oxidoreductase [Bacteroidales bacterium]|jgi:all-trans-retinol 13,14-reductase|nr:FAD-dependent oxidoreductase [Bacteroidales bacterium]
MPKYDIVIIGSGLGGLLCGAILSKEGKSVCILEKHHQFGGNLQTFKRDGKIFDTGFHYIGGLNKGQNLYQYFNYVGILDNLKLEQLNLDCFDKIGFNNQEYSFAQGFDNFIESLLRKFPSEKNALASYKSKIKDVCSHFPLYNLQIPNNLSSEQQYLETSIGDFLASITTNKALQHVLAGNNMLYAGSPEKTSLGIHALIENSFIEGGAYRFVDGSSQMTDHLVNIIKKNGGVLKKNSEVINFTIKNDQLCSAQLKNGEQIEGQQFISAISPYATLKMIDSGLIRKPYRDRINELEETISSFILYVSFKPESFNYLNYNYYHHNQNSVWTINEYDPNKWPQNYLFLTPPSAVSKEYAQTATALTYMRFDELNAWENTKTGRRGANYEEFKQQKAEKLILEIDKKFPRFKNSIQNYYTSTPLTYRDYTGTRFGSLYGIEHDCRNTLKTSILVRTKIPNLLFTGQNINLHGALGVTVGSVMTCSEILGTDYLLQKINNA